MIKLKITKVTLIEFVVAFVTILLIIAPAPGMGAFKYLDEFLGIVAMFIIGKKIKLILHDRFMSMIIICLGITLILGFISNLTAGLHTDLTAVLVDAYSVVKNHITFIGIFIGLQEKQKDKVLKFLYPFAVIFVDITFICGCINLVMDTPWVYDIRYGIRSFQFFFSNPAALGQAMMIALVIFDNVEDKINIQKILALLVMSLTLRAGILAIVFTYLIVTYFYKFLHRIRWYHMIIIGIGAFMVGYRMIQEYFLSQKSLRYILLQYGLIVCKRYLPLGAGFATYGSQMSYTYYSPLYYEFGFNHIWGFNQDYGGVINDNYWPMIMAQIGILGVLVQLLLLFSEFKIVISKERNRLNKRMALVLFLNLAISTLASANLTGVAGTVIYFVLALLLSNNNKQYIKKIYN